MKRKRKGMPTWLFVTILSVGITVGVGILALVLTFVLVHNGRKNEQGGQPAAFAARPVGPLKTYVRKAFTFDYPSSWVVDATDESYDPDHSFSIDASIGAMVMFHVADEVLDPAETLALHVKEHKERISNASQTDFTRWGKYDGRGATLKGRIGLLRGTLRLFAFNASKKTITVTEFFPDDEMQKLAPGYKTIENSFRVME